jgi:hypothetical protein
MTWFGHCITNVNSALKALPTAGQLMLISDLRYFLARQEQEIRRRSSGERELVANRAQARYAAGSRVPSSAQVLDD